MRHSLAKSAKEMSPSRLALITSFTRLSCERTPRGGKLARIMHHLPRFFLPGPDAYCTRTPSIRPVWIGVRQLAVQLVWV